jgi:peptidoglycan hydrolase-like protein with peptidoglycan-binding domain
MAMVETIEYQNDTIVLKRLTGFRIHPNFPRGEGRSAYYQRPGRKIRHVVLHSMAGPFRHGIKAVTGLSSFHTLPPKWKRDAVGQIEYVKGKPVKAGGGRGWPGPGYGFVVSYWPDLEDGRYVVYRLWDDEWVTWATGGHNEDTISVACAGMHETRWMPQWSAKNARDPERMQFMAVQSLVLDYLLPRYNLGPSDIRGHFDFGKVTCPGDVLEAWIRTMRGEAVGWLEPERRLWEEQTIDLSPPPVKPDRRPLDTWEDRQKALLCLGYDLGKLGADGRFGFRTRSAVEALQEREGLVVDGVWGPLTEGKVRARLAEIG